MLAMQASNAAGAMMSMGNASPTMSDDEVDDDARFDRGSSGQAVNW